MIPSEIMDVLHAAGDMVTHIWVDWHIGVICAIVSMIMVFTVDAKLVRRFMASGWRFSVWCRLAAHTFVRVVCTVCLYYGPTWTLRTAVSLAKRLYWTARGLFFYIVGFGRWNIIVFTTAVIVLVFLWQTALAVWHYIKRRR